MSTVSSESPNVQYSVQRELSDGSLNRISVRVPYFSKDDIHVYVSDIEIKDTTVEGSKYTWRWDGDYIAITPNVDQGIEVLVRRITPIDEAIHIFDGRSEFDDQSMDENFQQLIYIAQEYSEGSGIKDVFSDINMHGYKIRNVGRATEDADVVTYVQYREDALGARQARDEAKQHASDALSSMTTAQSSAGTAVSAGNRSEAILNNVSVLHDETQHYNAEAKKHLDNVVAIENKLQTGLDNLIEISEPIKNVNTNLPHVVKASEYATQYPTMIQNMNAIKDSAKTSADAAKQSATNANSEAMLAEQFANDSESHAQESARSATESLASANNSANSARQAGVYATNAKASETSSKTNADTAALHKDSAKSSADEAAIQAKRAEDFANQATQQQVQADWAQTSPVEKSFIRNKPTLGTLSSKDSLAYSELTGVPTEFTPKTHTHGIVQVTGLQSALDAKANDATLQTDLTAIRKSVDAVSKKVDGIDGTLSPTYAKKQSILDACDKALNGANPVHAGDPTLDEIKLALATIQAQLGQLESRRYVKETGKSSDGTSWYRKWSDGWIEQGGVSEPASSGTFDVTFNTPFTTKPNLLISPHDGSSEYSPRWATFGKNITKTGFQWYSTGIGIPIDWYACGY